MGAAQPVVLHRRDKVAQPRKLPELGGSSYLTAPKVSVQLPTQQFSGTGWDCSCTFTGAPAARLGPAGLPWPGSAWAGRRTPGGWSDLAIPDYPA